MSRLYISAAAVIALSPVLASQAVAQAQLPTREQVNPQGLATDQPKSEARVEDRNAFAVSSCPLDASKLSVAITQVVFSGQGGGALAPEFSKLLAGISPDAGEQPIRQVCHLRDLANAQLRQARYVATVRIPPQEIKDGVLRLEVISGRITAVRVRGEAGPFEAAIRSRVAKLTKLDPLNAGDAEKILVMANDIPGLNVQLGLSPDTTGKAGDLIGELTVNYRRLSLAANVQNYNSNQLGRETFYIRAETYGLLGIEDRTFVAGAGTFDFKKQLVAQIGESIGLSSAGDRLSLTATVANSRPDLDNVDLRTRTLIGNLEYTRPLLRTVNSKVELAAGFEYANQRTRIHGGGTSVALNLDRIATLFLRVAGDQRKLRIDGSQKWTLSGQLELRQGLDILGSTQTGVIVNGYSPSRFLGSAQATVLRGQFGGTIGLGPIFELASTVRGQYANKALLNYDQFALGNLTVGRGYDPGSNTGDRAIAGAHEVRANFKMGQTTRGQLYGFYDWIQLWNLDPASTERNRFLRSLGGGVRLNLYNSMRLDVTYAHPLDPPLLTGASIKPPSDRVMVSLTAQLIPFGARR